MFIELKENRKVSSEFLVRLCYLFGRRLACGGEASIFGVGTTPAEAGSRAGRAHRPQPSPGVRATCPQPPGAHPERGPAPSIVECAHTRHHTAKHAKFGSFTNITIASVLGMTSPRHHY